MDTQSDSPALDEKYRREQMRLDFVYWIAALLAIALLVWVAQGNDIIP